jgi:hypothetical protein
MGHTASLSEIVHSTLFILSCFPRRISTSWAQLSFYSSWNFGGIHLPYNSIFCIHEINIFGNVFLFSCVKMVRLKHEVWQSLGHLLHSIFQSMCYIDCLRFPSLTYMISFFHGILSVGFSAQTYCSIFRGNVEEGLSEYDKRQVLGPESQDKFYCL